jgi:hypothetical protein
MRERTLRQLIFEAVKVSLKQEALTKTEIHELTDYILDNSILELSAEIKIKSVFIYHRWI